MKNVFFVSIKPTLHDVANEPIDHIYARLGQNTGNLLFTKAVWSQIDFDHAESGFIFDPGYVNEKFDCVVIPAANWLRKGLDLSDLADRVEKLSVPVIMIGVGAQADSENEIPDIPDGTQRLMNAIAERSTLIGLRGEFTASVLRHYGIENTQVIGCPSMFYESENCQPIVKNPLKKLMLAGTRFYLSKFDQTHAGMMQRNIYKFAAKTASDINLQSERPELDLLLQLDTSGVDQKILSRVADYYGFDDKERFLAFIAKHGKAYTDVECWLLDMQRYDFYLGSRIHGALASLLAGTPACLITRDTRTEEMGRYAGIPQISAKETSELTLQKLERIYDRCDYSFFNSKRIENSKRYLEFLESNRLTHRLAGDASQR